MATWIAHLRVAERLLTTLPRIHRCGFCCGNLAPDSGIPNEDGSAFNPPSETTHYLHDKQSADLVFFREQMCPSPWEHLNTLETSFKLGYFCHLVCDNLWRELIFKPTRKRFQEQFDGNPNYIWTVKEDWYALDFLYIRSHPECLFWREFLHCEELPPILDFLPAEAVNLRLRDIQAYYRDGDDEMEAILTRPRRYLEQAQMDAYVQRAAVSLQIILSRLQQDPSAGAPPLRSSLALLEHNTAPL